MIFRISRLCRDERGTATIEYIGMMPFFILAMVIFWQFALAAYTFIVGETAAREAARAGAIVQSKWSPTGGAEPEWIDNVKEEAKVAAERVAGHLLAEVDTSLTLLEFGKKAEVTAKVTVNVPMMKARILENQTLTITRQATMAAEP